MTGALEFTVMGCGSSGGVPPANGDWGACDPAEPRNRRARCALLVRRKGEGAERETTLVVDTSPDLRAQLIGAEVRRLDGVALTHDHADQVHGIDDVRVFYQRRGSPIPCWMDEATAASLTRRFRYIFESEGGYPAICESRAIPEHGRPWVVEGPSGPIPVVTFDQDHGGVRTVGYRFGGVAYSSDVVNLDDAAFAALEGLDVWIVDALRYRPHPTHAHLERTLEWIARLRPRRAILTNLHTDMDYETLRARLPPGVEPAFDSLRFEHELQGENL